MYLKGKEKHLFSVLLVVFLLFGLTSCTLIDKLKARNYLNKGVKAYKDKDYESAVDNFKKAIELDPDLLRAYEYLAIAYASEFVPNLPTERNLKKAKIAIETFKKVLEFEPNNITAIQYLANLNQAIGDYDAAKKWYRKRLEVQPDNPEPLYGIGVIDWKLVNDETGNNGEMYKDLSPEEKAQKREKLEPLIDEAIQALKKALEINPDYADAMSYLNLCYRKKALFAEDEEMKKKYTQEADRLAIKAIELKKKLQREQEEKRKKIF